MSAGNDPSTQLRVINVAVNSGKPGGDSGGLFRRVLALPCGVQLNHITSRSPSGRAATSRQSDSVKGFPAFRGREVAERERGQGLTLEWTGFSVKHTM